MIGRPAVSAALPGWSNRSAVRRGGGYRQLIIPAAHAVAPPPSRLPWAVSIVATKQKRSVPGQSEARSPDSYSFRQAGARAGWQPCSADRADAAPQAALERSPDATAGARITPCGRNGAVSGPAEHSDGWPARPPWGWRAKQSPFKKFKTKRKKIPK